MNCPDKSTWEFRLVMLLSCSTKLLQISVKTWGERFVSEPLLETDSSHLQFHWLPQPCTKKEFGLSCYSNNRKALIVSPTCEWYLHSCWTSRRGRQIIYPQQSYRGTWCFSLISTHTLISCTSDKAAITQELSPPQGKARLVWMYCKWAPQHSSPLQKMDGNLSWSLPVPHSSWICQCEELSRLLRSDMSSLTAPLLELITQSNPVKRKNQGAALKERCAGRDHSATPLCSHLKRLACRCRTNILRNLPTSQTCL